ncbi:hypothetical protein ACFLWG_04685, partial [Chloroflexota bacterium]
VTGMNNRPFPKVFSEIIELEQKQGEVLMGNPVFIDWIKTFRKKYIVDGFLIPFYAYDGRYSRSRNRISKQGDYILPREMLGEVFHEGWEGWIRNEETWFWSYLGCGQETISWDKTVPEAIKIEGIPGKLIWQEIVSITRELRSFGDKGGGIFLPAELDADYLAENGGDFQQLEDDDGYMEQYDAPATPRWMTLFLKYESIQINSGDIEIRPAWFHLANQAFYNIPILRLSVFSCTYNSKGMIENLRFLRRELSDNARAFIGKALIDVPVKLKLQTRCLLKSHARNSPSRVKTVIQGRKK